MIINTDLIYPVGAIYISVSATNPGILFGGKWEQIKDRFLLTAGDTYTAGATGGSATHSHNYGVKVGGYYVDTVFAESTADGVFTWDSSNNRSIMHLNSSVGSESVNVNGGNTTSSKSANMAHYQAIANTSYTSTLPPYLVIYAWKRVS